MRRTLPFQVGAALLALALGATAASAKTVTLHYFSKQTSSTFVTPQGKSISGPPAAGDINDITGIDYVGDHQHHAKASTASEHLRCTITGFTGAGGTATCDGQIAIGGSMLLANGAHVTLSDSSAPFVVPINGGTGIYRRAHGTITARNVGNNTDFTIKVTY
jgi:hypothetical protein